MLVAPPAEPNAHYVICITLVRPTRADSPIVVVNDEDVAKPASSPGRGGFLDRLDGIW